MTCTTLAWLSLLGGAGIGAFITVAILFAANTVENRRRHQLPRHGVDDHT